MRMAFCEGRSTSTVARIRRGDSLSRNSSMRTAVLYGTSCPNCSKTVSRISSDTKKRTDWLESSSSG
jgi:hypothetical protein